MRNQHLFSEFESILSLRLSKAVIGHYVACGTVCIWALPLPSKPPEPRHSFNWQHLPTRMKGIILTDILKDLKSINFYYTNIAFYSNPTNFKKECSNLIFPICRAVGMSGCRMMNSDASRRSHVWRVTVALVRLKSATEECNLKPVELSGTWVRGRVFRRNQDVRTHI